MASRFGGAAGIVAIAAALLIAFALPLAGGSGTDYANGTYSFVVPASDYADASTVLVQDGVVTDVWISKAAAAQQLFGYTPQTPADMLYEGNNTEIAASGSGVTMCDRFDGGGENCNTFGEVRALSQGQARRISTWDGLPEGSADLLGRSVTWGLGDITRVSVDHAVIVDTAPHDGLINGLDTSALEDTGVWVRYRVGGESDPFAICLDSPNASDEEVCYQWGTAAG